MSRLHTTSTNPFRIYATIVLCICAFMLFCLYSNGLCSDIDIYQNGNDNLASGTQIGLSSKLELFQSGNNNIAGKQNTIYSIHAYEDLSPTCPDLANLPIGQVGDSNIINIRQVGIWNEIYGWQKGQNNYALISQFGNHNYAAINQINNNNVLDLTQNGNCNIVVSQDGSNSTISSASLPNVIKTTYSNVKINQTNNNLNISTW